MKHNWLITGSSRGFGWELAKAALDRGDNVVATARRPEQLASLVKSYGESVRTVALDVTDTESARAAVQAAVDSVRIPRCRGEQRRLRQQCSD